MELKKGKKIKIQIESESDQLSSDVAAGYTKKIGLEIIEKEKKKVDKSEV